MQIIPMTAEEALEYAPKAALLDFDGPITPDLIAALRGHLGYAISALSALSAKLHEAEATIVDLHQSNLELAGLLNALNSPSLVLDYKRPSSRKQKGVKWEDNGGIDPEYGTQLSIDDRFDDVPSREPIDIIDGPLGLERVSPEGENNLGLFFERFQEAHQIGPAPVTEGAVVIDTDSGEVMRHDGKQWFRDDRATVEFRTDPATYDANRGEIHRMLAEEIVATFGQDKSAGNPSERGTETDSE